MNGRDALRATLLELLEEEMGEDFGPIDEEADLREGLGLDSVDVVGLVMRVERHFRIRLAMEELMDVRQFAQLLDLVQSKLDGRGEEAGARGPQSHAA
ncbi:acyl carrier protein [Aquisphaera giovannonii]|uniref:Acyl carrier protein n=1 Tax=Aquisphaera giovannonii TaxID=406548 RepID=A0A5B9W747_9BACT|nr:acyl carrier protein [Aquisphaera giovannonii]QEH36177.1 acyl carrier protein [Aquisphaera giovannonii]